MAAKPDQPFFNKLLILLIPVAIVAGVIYATLGKGGIATLTLAIGWSIAILLGATVLTVLAQIWNGSIDMSKLFSEGESGQASFSRFQFFIFTFVIAMCLFLVTVGKEGEAPRFRDVPNTILMLLGISSGSYLVAKGIAEKDEKVEGGGEPTSTDPAAAPPGAPVDAKEKLAKVEFLLNTRLKTLGEEQAADDPKTRELRATLKQLLESAQGA